MRVVMTVPAGWEGGQFNIAKAPARELPDGTNVLFRQPTSVFADPCAPELSADPIGPTVDDLAAALADLPNVTDATQADVTISGFSGKHVSFVVDTAGIDCVMGIYGQDAFVRAADNGQRQDLWILDVAGTRLVIDAATYPRLQRETGPRCRPSSTRSSSSRLTERRPIQSGNASGPRSASSEASFAWSSDGSQVKG